MVVVKLVCTHIRFRDDHSRILSQIKLFLVDEVSMLLSSRLEINQ